MKLSDFKALNDLPLDWINFSVFFAVISFLKYEPKQEALLEANIWEKTLPTPRVPPVIKQTWFLSVESFLFLKIKSCKCSTGSGLKNEIIVIDEGKIKERGTHAELIANEGVYFKLYNMQSFD